MAIYKRCTKCFKENQLNLKKCRKCLSILGGEKYLVKVKDPQTGKWITKTVPSLKLAKKAETKFKTIIIEESILDKKKKDDVSFERYLAHAKLNKKSWYDDEKRWALYVKSNRWHTTQGIQKILGKMQQQGLKPATVHHALKLIKRVYNYHIQLGLCQKNPCDTIKAPKYDNRVNNVLTQEQILSLLKYLQNWENRRAALVIQFALYTGRRKSEILNLEWHNVSGDKYTCCNTKNGSTLTFPLNTEAEKVIHEAESIKVSDLVFPCSTGKYYHSFSSVWSRLKKRFPLKIRFHDLRHTYASYLASNGASIYVLKELLGHKDIKLTERYSHLSNKCLADTNNLITALSK